MRTSNEPVSTAGERAARLRSLRVVVASDPVVSEPPPPSVDTPDEDYVILGRLFDTTYVDPKVVAARGRLSRLAARVAGDPMVVAFRAVRTARNADALIAMGDDVGLLIAAWKLVLRSRTPYIMICNHMRSRKAQLLLGRLGLQRKVQRFLPCSTFLRDHLAEEYGIAQDQMDILYNTVDHRFFTTDTDRESPRQIVSAGLTLRDYKTLLDATRGLDADVKIEANSAWYDLPVNFTTADLHDGVELCNDGTTSGLRELYATSAIVAVPLVEVGEPAGNTTVLEGMAMGKAVVASDIVMGGDYIRPGETGFLVPAEDPAALRACLVELLADESLRRRIGRAARAAVEAEFTRDHFATTIEAAVDAVTPRRG